MDIVFTWDGEFTHDFLAAIVETPPDNFQPDSPMPGNATVDDFEFFGVSMEQMQALLLEFGNCNLHFKVDMVVELNGFDITKIYIPKGATLFFDFKSENTLPELVHTTSDIVMKAYPDHKLDFARDNKSFNFYCSYPNPFVIYEKPAPASENGNTTSTEPENDEDVDLSKMGGKKPEGVKIKLKGNKVIMTYKDKKTPTTMTMVIERIKGK